MIRNNLYDVFYIGIDNIGSRIQACGLLRNGQDGELRRECLHNSICLLLKFDSMQTLFKQLNGFIYPIHSSNANLEKEIKYALHYAVQYSTNARLKSVAFVFMKHLYALVQSIQSSDCLRLCNVANNEIIIRFQYSLNTDVASSRLKLASILYSGGNLHAAVRVSADVGRRCHNRVKAVCACRRIEGDDNIPVFANMISGNSDDGFIEPPFALCVRFHWKEAYCCPNILLFEMNRNITEEEVAQRSYFEKLWMGCAEVDARPFLHYLQYLTYGGLGERDKQIRALGVFDSYMNDIVKKIYLYHRETALNLLGHSNEMEADYERTLSYYTMSLRVFNPNNAANWHVRKVLRLLRA
ncbi:hypothetical protein DPMN_171662 [Dreissena polymorpha]|uniref:Uncharacterized protein n=1 Tax=Dreissena polymorpha TaxID=45954 RepID=A0A9D4IFC9_DREPO|nr:hypothetical protein DPMN_171662 [Dreissena polymorpha]